MIAALRRRAKPRSNVVHLGIGDDCAILRPAAGEELVVTADLSIEGTHFRRDWHPPASIGHRCLARGLSDIAAMGATPVAAFLSLGFPPRLSERWLDQFFRGFFALAERHSVTLAGGDIGESDWGVVADVMVVGKVKRGKAVMRSGARVGDVIYVTGALGGSAATLEKLSSGTFTRRSSRPNPAPGLAGGEKRHYFPEPRITAGAILRKRKIAHAMIDISDGLSTDLQHVCDESRVGAALNMHLIPIARGARLDQALHGGEDYELLFTASARARVPLEVEGVPITEIGWITRQRGMVITDLKSKPVELRAEGWQHFGAHFGARGARS